MDTTFISIHDLSQDARILYVSNSIFEVLGFNPEEVLGRSCWDYFHPDELPFARSTHGRGVSLDRASVLNYCRIKSKSGWWIGCECVFTVVYDVLVGCTSVYHMDAKSQMRANDAPIVRQLFSSSPRDPRYHMLSYISAKFSQGPSAHLHEPRAALFLNRFTRSLTVMYATNGLAGVLGISSAELVGKSFYYCIAENCLPEAVRCLESAKANDSIAYLRFWYRDPRQDDMDTDERMSDGHSSDQDSEGGGVQLNQAESDLSDGGAETASSTYTRHRLTARRLGGGVTFDSPEGSGTSSSVITDGDEPNAFDRVFDRPGLGAAQSSASSLSVGRSAGSSRVAEQSHELEAVVSCTSDGLVVVIREARPFVPDSLRQPPARATAPQPRFTDGQCASPWAHEPILPAQHQVPQGGSFSRPTPVATTVPRSMAPSFHHPTAATAPPAAVVSPVNLAAPAGVPAVSQQEAFMQTIREVAVFAWALTGINGSMARWAKGAPAAGAQPYGGLPVWQPDAKGMAQHIGKKWNVEDRMQD